MLSYGLTTFRSRLEKNLSLGIVKLVKLQSLVPKRCTKNIALRRYASFVNIFYGVTLPARAEHVLFLEIRHARLSRFSKVAPPALVKRVTTCQYKYIQNLHNSKGHTFVIIRIQQDFGIKLGSVLPTFNRYRSCCLKGCSYEPG